MGARKGIHINTFYKKLFLISSLLILLLFAKQSFSCKCDSSNNSYNGYWFTDLYHNVICDYSVYYSPNNLLTLGGVFLIAGIMANTNIDNSIHHFWQKNIRSKGSDQFFKFPRQWGKFNYLKVYIGSSILGYFRKENEIGNIIYTWGDRALRTMLLLSPQEVFVSWALGNGKPSDNADSKWRFFGKGGVAGCSGHAFNGAVPFFTAAMMTEEPLLRYGLYTLGLLPGLSRINSDSHYFSQVLIGWALVFLSAKAVVLSDEIQCCTTKIQFCPLKKGGMVSACVQF